MSRVFVGIPTFNRPDLVVETVESARRQSFTDFEVVVSDNCSDGDTADRVRSHVEALRDPRFRFVGQPENRGEYGQGRYFLEASAGSEYLMILHDDDLLEPDYLRIAVNTLDNRRDAALFVANPRLIDGNGEILAQETRSYLNHHGRTGQPSGAFSVLDAHLASGFTPISGTLFRREALLASGFVDPSAVGNFPFECDLLLRLGDSGAVGWFSPAQLLFIRFHQGSLRNTLQLMDNPQVVGAMLKLFGGRRYHGWRERRRLALMSRLHRAEAMIHLARGDIERCRASQRAAIRFNPLSPRGWAAWLRLLFVPARSHAVMPVAVPALVHEVEPRTPRNDDTPVPQPLLEDVAG